MLGEVHAVEAGLVGRGVKLQALVIDLVQGSVCILDMIEKADEHGVSPGGRVSRKPNRQSGDGKAR